MRWLVAGAAGMLGRDLVALLDRSGHHVTAAARGELDVTSSTACGEAVASHDVVVNCAAYTAVDDAESDEANAFAVNAVGAANLARAAGSQQIRLVHVSTDYVFAGDADTPYAETAAPAPATAYGRTKAAGEWAVRAQCPDSLVVRTAWLYGRHGGCFPKTIARLLGERDVIDVVDDQHGQPTWTADVAGLVVRLVEGKAPAGTYHATSAGSTTWYAFARAVAAEAGADPDRVRPTSSAAFVRPAPRPSYSVLGHDALAVAQIAPIGQWASRWQTAAASVLG